MIQRMGAQPPVSTTTAMTSTAPITSLITTYILAIRQFGQDAVYRSLKENYSDVCSHGDVVINDIIDTLDALCHKSTETLEKALMTMKDADRFAYHTEETLKWWIEDNKCTPDASWAS